MKYPSVVELRLRGRWAPAGGFRYEIGRPASKAAADRMQVTKDLLRRLGRRGDWDTLNAVADGRVTPEQLKAVVDRFGVEDYRPHLVLTGPKPGAAAAPTLDEHTTSWLEDCDRNPDLRRTSVVQYRAHIKRLAAFEQEGVRLGDGPWYRVPRHTIRDAKNSLNLAPNTIRTVLGAWSAFFEWALAREESAAEHEGRPPLMESNPVRRAKVWSKIQKTRHRFLTPAEFQRLLDVSPAPMRAQYATLVLAGLRIEEFMKLPPAHVRLPGTIHIGKWGDWQPKVERSIRDVPIHPELLPYLKAYRDEHGGSELAFFVNPASGRPWVHGTFYERMRIDIEAAGMRYGAWSRSTGELERKSDGVTPHTLRHTFGSWLAQADVQLMKIAALMGDTEETVRDHYVHFVPTDLEVAITRLPTLAKRKKNR